MIQAIKVKENVKKKQKSSSAKKSIKDIYIIESLVEKKGSKYLVKWENWPPESNTWEPKSSIPEFIVKVCKKSYSYVSYDDLYLYYSTTKTTSQD